MGFPPYGGFCGFSLKSYFIIIVSYFTIFVNTCNQKVSGGGAVSETGAVRGIRKVV